MEKLTKNQKPSRKEQSTQVISFIGTYVRPDEGSKNLILYHSDLAHAAALAWIGFSDFGQKAEVIGFSDLEAEKQQIFAHVDRLKSTPNIRKLKLIVISNSHLPSEFFSQGKLEVFHISCPTE